jgi:hypothetical protein
MHRTDRWLEIMEFLEGMGGTVHMNLAGLSAALGIHRNGIQRYLSRMEELGVVSTVRQTSAFGQGRDPNRYTLLVSTAAWLETGDQIVKEYNAAKRARRKANDAPRRPERALPAIPEPDAPPTVEEIVLAKADADEELEAGDDLEGWRDLDDLDDD